MNENIEMLLEKSELIYVRQSKYTKEEWHSSIHSHYFSEILIVLNGKGNFIVEQQKYPIKERDVIIVNPYVRHTETSSGEYPLWYVVIGINNLKFEQQKKDQQHFIFRDHLGDYLPLLKLAIAEINKNDWGCQAALKRIAELLVINIYRDQKFRLVPAEDKRRNKDSVLIKEFIDQHFKEPLSLDDIANCIHLDKFYIIHTFKKNYQVTPMSYLLKKRLQNACELLESTDYQVAEIAVITGFASQSYFNQAFKKEFTASPLQYRKSHRGLH